MINKDIDSNKNKFSKKHKLPKKQISQKYARPVFFFKQPENEVVSLLDEKFPLNLSYLEDIFTEIHDRYPYVEKMEVVQEIMNFLLSVREGLVRRKIFSFYKLVRRLRLRFVFSKNEENKVLCKLLVTPKKLKRKE